MTNIVGGFLITDRMLKMFKTKARGGNPMNEVLRQFSYMVRRALCVFRFSG